MYVVYKCSFTPHQMGRTDSCQNECGTFSITIPSFPTLFLVRLWISICRHGCFVERRKFCGCFFFHMNKSVTMLLILSTWNLTKRLDLIDPLARTGDETAGRLGQIFSFLPVRKLFCALCNSLFRCFDAKLAILIGYLMKIVSLIPCQWGISELVTVSRTVIKKNSLHRWKDVIHYESSSRCKLALCWRKSSKL